PIGRRRSWRTWGRGERWPRCDEARSEVECGGDTKEEVKNMATVEEKVLPLYPGQRLPREEFLRRWEALPDLKFAELIGGMVYMPSPLSLEHGWMDSRVATWLGVYVAATPGCESASNATWLLMTDAPQPDQALQILPEYGGKSRVQGRYGLG